MSEDAVLDRQALVRLDRIGGTVLVRSMVELYLEHGTARLQALADGVQRDDAGQVERAAHTLRSTAANLGATRLQQCAAALEALAATGVVDAALADRVQREYDLSAALLRQVIEELGS